MHLVQILLPTYGPAGERLDDSLFTVVRRELTDRFGGVTAYVRAPATGLWQREDGRIERDEIIMVEVMVDQLDRRWWAAYTHDLEQRFRQEKIVSRAIAITPLEDQPDETA